MKRYPTLITLWLITDLIAFLEAYAVAYFLRVGFIFSTDLPFKQYLLTAAITAPVWLTALVTTRTFALGRSQSSKRNLAYIVYASLVGTAVFALVNYFGYQLVLSRMLLVYCMALTIVYTWVWHMLFSYVMRRQLRKPPATFPTLIVGVNRESTRLVENLNKHLNPLTPVAILDGRGAKVSEVDGVPVKGKLNKLEEVLEQDNITHLIQCSDLEQSLNLLSACRNRGITYLLLPSVLGIIERDERVDTLDGQPATVVSPKGPWWSWFFQ